MPCVFRKFYTIIIYCFDALSRFPSRKFVRVFDAVRKRSMRAPHPQSQVSLKSMSVARSVNIRVRQAAYKRPMTSQTKPAYFVHGCKPNSRAKQKTQPKAGINASVKKFLSLSSAGKNQKCISAAKFTAVKASRAQNVTISADRSQGTVSTAMYATTPIIHSL